MSRSPLATAVVASATLCACATAAPTTSAPEAPLTRLAADPSLQWGPCPPIFTGACNIAVLHGNPAHPNADVLLRVGPGQDLAEHWHSSAERMILVSGELEVQYRGAARTTLTPGEYAYGPARLPHRGKCVSTSECVLFVAFEGPVDAHAAGT